jgi:hypothetical protein
VRLIRFLVEEMHYLIFMLFLIVALVGLISLIFGFPGNFIILADSVLYGWYGGFREVTLKVVMVLVLLAILGLPVQSRAESLAVFVALLFFLESVQFSAPFWGPLPGPFWLSSFVERDWIRRWNQGVGLSLEG